LTIVGADAARLCTVRVNAIVGPLLQVVFLQV
jgi:hypothetical protein